MDDSDVYEHLYVIFKWNGEKMIAYRADGGIRFSREDEVSFASDTIHRSEEEGEMKEEDDLFFSPESKNPLNLDLNSKKDIELEYNFETNEGSVESLWVIETRELYKDIESFLTEGEKFEEIVYAEEYDRDGDTFFTTPLRF